MKIAFVIAKTWEPACAKYWSIEQGEWVTGQKATLFATREDALFVLQFFGGAEIVEFNVPKDSPIINLGKSNE